METIYAKLAIALEFAIDGVGYFVIAMLGAVIKDLYDTETGKRPRIEIYRIFVSATLTTFITFALTDYIPKNCVPMFNFILGLLGCELFVRISTIAGLVQTINDIKTIAMDIFTIRDAAKGIKSSNSSPTIQINNSASNTVNKDKKEAGK